MNLFALMAIAIGLAMDAFSVAIAKGVSLKEFKIANALKVALFFGGFQAIMPLIGWMIGERFSTYIATSAHWIAFVLMLLLGGKMIYESVTEGEPEKIEANPIKTSALIVLSIATSIDALLVGFTIALFETPILLAVTIIGIITFVICYFGVWLGSKIGGYLGRYATVIGGVILIAIGVIMLLEGY